MKSLNLNFKSACKLCNIAKGRKRARLEAEEGANLSEDEENNVEENNNEEGIDEESNDLLEEDEVMGSKKRKRSGENHTHCHCNLFEVTDPLLEFMSAGQPYHRFKLDQVKRTGAEKVDRVLATQKRKQAENKYK